MSYERTRTNWFVGLDNTQDLRNLVNNTGNDGYLKFTDNNYETICQMSQRNYNELTNKPVLFSGSWYNLNDKPIILTSTDVETLITNKAPTAGANKEISATNVMSATLPTILTEVQVSAIIDSCNFLTDFTIPAEYATSNAFRAIIDSCNFLTDFTT